MTCLDLYCEKGEGGYYQRYATVVSTIARVIVQGDQTPSSESSVSNLCSTGSFEGGYLSEWALLSRSVLQTMAVTTSGSPRKGLLLVALATLLVMFTCAPTDAALLQGR